MIWPISDALHRTPRRRAVRSRAAADELPSPSFEAPAPTPELPVAPSESTSVEFPIAPSELPTPPADGGASETLQPSSSAPEFPVAPSERREASTAEASAYLPAAEPASSRRWLPSLRWRLGSPARDVSIVLGTVAVAIGVGIGAATLIGSDGGSGGDSAGRASAAQATQATASAPADAGPSTLQGVAPDFSGGAADAQSATAAQTTSSDTQAQVSPTAQTNAKPSSIPPGVAENIDAMNTARDFAGAFVLYEVGATNAKVKRTFARTATPSLARALRDRPPRLPNAVQVPTAKVQNVVLGTERGGEVEASVSLLRLGDLSELRLTLSKRDGSWAVSEVRG